MNNNRLVLLLLLLIILIPLFYESLYRKYLGIHYIIDINDVDPDIIYNNEKLIQICDNCLSKCNVNILNKSFHEFKPHGLTLLYLLSESHFSLHTWPEERKLRMDFFSCTTMEKCEIGVEYLRKEFSNSNIYVDRFLR